MELKIMKIILILIIIYFTIYIIDVLKNKEYFESNEPIEPIEPIDYSINQIKPQININPNAPIAFVYVYTPNIYDYCQHSIKNLTAYVQKYNYGLVIYNDVFNQNVSPCWNKIAAIRKNLQSHQYIVWFDADAIVNNFDIRIDSFINKYPDVDLIACLDIYKEKECINSGVMIIKNTSWSNNLFKRVWDSPIPHGHNDQNVIFYTIVQDLYPNATQTLKNNSFCFTLTHTHTHPKVKILEENAFNTNIQSYRPGDFILHLMGAAKESRINIMRQVNTQLGLDSYTSKECLYTINNYFGSDRVDKIRSICFDSNT
jgi:hypothetical protein